MLICSSYLALPFQTLATSMQALQAGPRSLLCKQQVLPAAVKVKSATVINRQPCVPAQPLLLTKKPSLGSWSSQLYTTRTESSHIAKAAAGAVPAGEPAQPSASGGTSNFTQAVFNVVGG